MPGCAQTPLTDTMPWRRGERAGQTMERLSAMSAEDVLVWLHDIGASAECKAALQAYGVTGTSPPSPRARSLPVCAPLSHASSTARSFALALVFLPLLPSCHGATERLASLARADGITG